MNGALVPGMGPALQVGESSEADADDGTLSVTGPIALTGTTTATLTGGTGVTLKATTGTAHLDSGSSTDRAQVIANGASGGSVAVYTGGTLRLTLAASGNLVVGSATESAWDETGVGNVIQGPSTAIAWGISGTTGDLYICSNNYFDGAWKRKGIGEACQLDCYQGEFLFRTATSGAAGAAITWTPAATIDVLGRFIVGATAKVITAIADGVHVVRATTSANVVGGRSTATTSGSLFTVTGHNGSTEVASIKFDAGGATDSGDVVIGTRPTGGSIITRFTVTNSGNVVCGNGGIATNATDGFLMIPGMAGAPSGTPVTFSGRAALVYDYTNNKLYAYNYGATAWKSVTLT